MNYTIDSLRDETVFVENPQNGYGSFFRRFFRGRRLFFYALQGDSRKHCDFVAGTHCLATSSVAPGNIPETKMHMITNDDYAEFIGPNADKYIFNFAKFQTLRDGFTVTWHWPAFLFGFWWFLYRKMYFWAFVTFLVGFLPFGNFIAQLGYGMSAYYFYYRDSTAKIGAIKSTAPVGGASIAMRQTGGVHGWVTIVGLVCFFLQPIWIFLMTVLFGGAFIVSFQQVML